MTESSTKHLAQKHSFIIFLALTVLISWFPWYTSGSGFFVFGPSIAGVIVIALVKGKNGLKELTQRALQWKVGIRWWGVALFFTGFIGLLSVFLNTFLGGELPSFRFFREEWYLIPVFFLLTILGGPLGEEFGWRGFALPKLQNKWGAIPASIMLGIIWAMWHFPLFFQEGSIHAQMGFKLLPYYILGEIVLSIIMTWVYNKTGGSLLLGGIILHNADNLWATLLFTSETMTSAFEGGTQAEFDAQLYILTTLVGVVTVIILAIATKWRLGFSQNQELVNQEIRKSVNQ